MAVGVDGLAFCAPHTVRQAASRSPGRPCPVSLVRPVKLPEVYSGDPRTRSSRQKHAGTIRRPNQIPGGNPTNKIINGAFRPILKGRG